MMHPVSSMANHKDDRAALARQRRWDERENLPRLDRGTATSRPKAMVRADNRRRNKVARASRRANR